MAEQIADKSYELTGNSKTFLLVLLTRLIYHLCNICLTLLQSGFWGV